MASNDDLVHRIRAADGEPEGAIVLLHGRGTDENDLAPVIDVLDPERRLVGVTPRAPLNLPPGGWHWYVVHRVGFPDRDTFFETYSLAAGWLDATLDSLGVPVGRTILGGFSMGAVMTYALGLGAGRPRPAGILALSGFIPAVEGFSLDLTGLDGYPVAIAHGTFDPIIRVDFGRQAAAVLEDAGAAVSYRESPVPHAVDPGFVHELSGWVRAVLRGERTQADRAGP
jgi:phospholipase/carboxylesterase